MTITIFYSTATTTPWIYTLSLHDALPILEEGRGLSGQELDDRSPDEQRRRIDRAHHHHHRGLALGERRFIARGAQRDSPGFVLETRAGLPGDEMQRTDHRLARRRRRSRSEEQNRRDERAQRPASGRYAAIA